MSDNRFSDYPTKRLPGRNSTNGADQTKRMPGKDELDDLNYTDDIENPTKPTVLKRETRVEPRRRSDRPIPNVERPTRIPEKVEKPEKKNGMSIKTKLSLMYIVVLVFAVAACIYAIVNVSQRLFADRPGIAQMPGRNGYDENDNDNDQPGGRPGRPVEANMTAMVIGISSSPRSLTLMNIHSDERETIELPLADDTTFVNRPARPLTFSSLMVGHIVEITYDAREPAEIIRVMESPHSREHVNLTGAHYNPENRTISAGHQSFQLAPGALVLQQDRQIHPDTIEPADSVTIIEYRNVAWAIRLEYSHGFLNITNASGISNGLISVGTRQIFLDEITGPITVAEGSHRIVVEGTNIETFIDNIVVAQSQTVVLDLSDVQLRTGTLHIVTNPPESDIFIDDELLTTPSPATLYFGEHTIRVEHEGYYPMEQVVIVNSPISNVTFNLEEMVQLATLEIITYPPNARIFVNSVPVGLSPLTHELDPGTYMITIELAGYIENVSNITLDARQHVVRTIHLTAMQIPIPDPPPVPDPPAPPDPLPPDPPPPDPAPTDPDPGPSTNNDGGSQLPLPPPPPPAP